MSEEDWEMIPHKVIADLRDEVHALKERVSTPSADKELLAALNELKLSIKQMQDIFQAALTKISEEEEEELSLIKMIQDLGKKLPDIEKQNEQIAKAMVAIAEMVEGLDKKPSVPALPVNPSTSPPLNPPAMFRSGSSPLRPANRPFVPGPAPLFSSENELPPLPTDLGFPPMSAPPLSTDKWGTSLGGLPPPPPPKKKSILGVFRR